MSDEKQKEATPALAVATCSAVECPNCGRLTTGGLFGSPPVGEGQYSATHCGCYHEPKGGERFTAERDAIWDQPNTKSSRGTAQP